MSEARERLSFIKHIFRMVFIVNQLLIFLMKWLPLKSAAIVQSSMNNMRLKYII